MLRLVLIKMIREARKGKITILFGLGKVLQVEKEAHVFGDE